MSLASSSASGGFAATSNGPFTRTLAVTIPVGSTTSPAFYYEDTVAGAPVLTASAGFVSAVTQSETVNPGLLARISLSPTGATLVEGASQALVATAYDRYTNQVVAGFAPSWSATFGGGTFAPDKGVSTTFTAPNVPANGSITANQTGIQAAASVTVRALSQPAALVNSASWMNVFSVDESGDLVNRWWQGSSGWHTQVLATGAVGSPSVVLNGPTWMDVFYASTSGKFDERLVAVEERLARPGPGDRHRRVAGGGRSDQHNHERLLPGNQRRPDGRSWLPSTGWQVQEVESGIGGTPSAVANSATWMNVFYRSAGGELMNAWWQPTSGWHVQGLTNGDAGTPAAVVNSQTWMNVFFIGTSSELMNAWWGSTSGWHVQPLESGAAGTPTAVVNSSTWMNVFYESSAGG